MDREIGLPVIEWKLHVELRQYGTYSIPCLLGVYQHCVLITEWIW